MTQTRLTDSSDSSNQNSSSDEEQSWRSKISNERNKDKEAKIMKFRRNLKLNENESNKLKRHKTSTTEGNEDDYITSSTGINDTDSTESEKRTATQFTFSNYSPVPL